MTGRIHSLQTSKGGVPKLPVLLAEVTAAGLAGDAQRNLKHHGGPDRAVCLWSLEVIEALRAEGHSLAPGWAGENVTLAGVPWDRVVPGARLALGAEVMVEITSFAVPCKHLVPYFAGGAFGRIHPAKHPGSARAYARVLRGGTLAPGDAAAVL